MTLGAKPFFWPFFTWTFLSLILLSHKHSPLVLALFHMADNGWIGGICHAEPGLPKLLILSLERIGVVDPPEYVYREYDSRGTLRCDMMIFVGKSTRYPDVDPWFISTTGFRFPDTYRKAARKALRRSGCHGSRAALERPCQVHGGVKILGCPELDVDVDVIREATHK